MWTCPACKKSFKTTNQWHSCYSREVTDHLANKPEIIIDTYKKLESIILSFGEIEIRPVKTSIQFRAGANFASLKITGKYIQVEFQLPQEVEEFPIHETLRMSRNRVLHRLMVEEPEEVDQQISDWLLQSYQLVLGT